MADSSIAEQFAEIDVILLMFGVCLQFHIDELLAVRHVAVPGAVLQSAVATELGALLTYWLGWDGHRAQRRGDPGAARGGHRCNYGNAPRPETLAAASIARAGALILGSAGMANGAEVIRLARSLNPNIRVLARAAYLRDVLPLQEAGAKRGLFGRRRGGAGVHRGHLRFAWRNAEQIDRARERAHRELLSQT